MHFGKSHLEDKREDLQSHYGKIEKTAGVTALHRVLSSSCRSRLRCRACDRRCPRRD